MDKPKPGTDAREGATCALVGGARSAFLLHVDVLQRAECIVPDRQWHGGWLRG
jgi:hypothetical protein